MKKLKLTKNNILMFFVIEFLLNIAFYQFFKNDCTFINHVLFFRGKYSLELCFQL